MGNFPEQVSEQSIVAVGPAVDAKRYRGRGGNAVSPLQPGFPGGTLILNIRCFDGNPDGPGVFPNARVTSWPMTKKEITSFIAHPRT